MMVLQKRKRVNEITALRGEIPKRMAVSGFAKGNHAQ